MAPPAMENTLDTVYAGKDTIYRYYTIDTTLQKHAERLFGQYCPQYGIAAIVHPQSGRVLALASYTHDSARVLGDHLCLRSFLPAASLFKTVVAAAAIEKAGYVDSTAIPVKGRNHTLYKSQLKRHIEPWNEVEFGEAYARSINPVFARIGMYALGQTTLNEYSTRFGFNDCIPFEMATDTSRVAVPPDTSYAMAECASGFNRITTLSALHGALVSAVALTGGTMPQPRLIDSIVHRNGRCLYRGEFRLWKSAVTASTAVQLRTIMVRVVEHGTARRSFRTFKWNRWSSEVEVGGKTGSLSVDTLGKIDWFTGYAALRDDRKTSLALAVAMVHGRIWTVHSAYIAAEIVKGYFRPRKTGLSTRDLTIPVTIDSVDTVKAPEG
jgi:peptidoglycan glycosyltransferase